MWGGEEEEKSLPHALECLHDGLTSFNMHAPNPYIHTYIHTLVFFSLSCMYVCFCICILSHRIGKAARKPRVRDQHPQELPAREYRRALRHQGARGGGRGCVPPVVCAKSDIHMYIREITHLSRRFLFFDIAAEVHAQTRTRLRIFFVSHSAVLHLTNRLSARLALSKLALGAIPHQYKKSCTLQSIT